MRLLRDFLVLTALTALVLGQIYIALADVALDLHDWGTRCWGLLRLYVDASGQLTWREDESPYGLDAFRPLAWDEGRVRYCLWKGIRLLLGEREVLDARMEVRVHVEPEEADLLRAIELSAELGRAFAFVESSGLRLEAHGLKSLRELELAFVEVSLDLSGIRDFLASCPEQRPVIVAVSVELAFLTKTRMEVLRPRGMVISAIGCSLLIVGLARPGGRRPLRAREIAILLASLALMAAGDILLHLAWSGCPTYAPTPRPSCRPRSRQGRGTGIMNS